MKKVVAVALLFGLVWTLGRWDSVDRTGSPHADRQSATQSESAPRAGSQFGSEGTVIRVLPDDNQGSRHQRFILRLASGQTVLIAHNIDIAPRVEGLTVGDTVSFSGEFEENNKGGVVHWTHHDPSGRHVAGWVEHRGRVYQ